MNTSRKISNGEKTATITEIVNQRMRFQAGKEALSFLADGESDVLTWDYATLGREFNKVAGQLALKRIRGERMILLFEPGLDYIAAFLGCLAAGAVAVPAYPPSSKRFGERIMGIIADCRPKFILTTRALAESYRQRLGDTSGCEWLCIDEFHPETPLPDAPPALDDLAMLQYTSGSTGNPKGVKISHGNIVSNCAAAKEWLGEDPGRVGGIWLPPYHDMGLLGGILQPLYAGFPLYFMSPMHFIQSPVRWLKMISAHGVTLSGAPNFAYDLCVKSIREEDAARLDLRRWSQAFCGAEMIRPEVLRSFAERFARQGLRPEAITPCYGLAESTLIVSGKRKDSRPLYLEFDRESLDAGKVLSAKDPSAAIRPQSRLELSGCGQVCSEYALRIVDPHSLMECEKGMVGEIWVSGPSVAGGYWEKARETHAAFEATLPGGRERYLRTGDLGFITEGQLFVAGRIKDLVVIAGVNHYPEDLEATARDALDGSRSAAAFSIAGEKEELMVIILEWAGQPQPREEKLREIKVRIANMHGITPHDVVLVRTGAIPRTTSGKIRRSATRELYLAGKLKNLSMQPSALEEA
jgi:acyl-CoA synthetase (AMP-forming)/AMP-acid ligase II